MATLKKQFQKELKTNPKKAAILGLLALVAVYFWIPLAIKLVTGGKSKGAKSNTAVVVESSPSDVITPSETESSGKNATATENNLGTVSYRWDQILEWIQTDPLMTSCKVLQNKHDPFERVEKVIELPKTAQPLAMESAAEAPPVERDLSPEALGMQLTSTIVGTGRSVAMIDERAYALGQKVVAFDGITPLKFKLLAIRPEFVILEREKKQFTLKLKQTDELEVSLSETEGTTGL